MIARIVPTLFLLLLFFLSACATKTPVLETPVGAGPTPTPTSRTASGTATPTIQPNETPRPTATPTLPTRPTSTPRPPATPTPRPTPTPVAATSPGTRLAFDDARLAELDSYALATPKTAEASIKGLAAYLTVPARDDFEKTRLIYRWLARNVSYDAPAFFSKNLGDQSAEATLRKRTAVCGGYSALFQALGRAAGLEITTVEGWAKGFGYDVAELDGDPNHAWNAVRIAGGWYLVDSTWGAGSLTKEGKFEPEFKPYFWLTPPDQFVVNHLPVEARFQLLPAPLTRTQYAVAPLLQPPFFQYGLGLPSETIATTKVASQATLLVSAPPDVFLTATIEQDGLALDDMWVSARRQGAQYQIDAVFPAPGAYDLVIFAKRGDHTTMYDGAVTLGYVVSQGQSQFAGFPKLLDPFDDYGLRLPPGTGAIARVAARATLLVGAPPDVLLMAAVEQDSDDRWAFVQRKGDSYEVEVAFPGPGKYTLIIYAKRQTEAGDYKGAVKLVYEVSQGQPQFAGFPKVFRKFTESGSYLYTPRESGLPANSSVTFKLDVPGAQQVAVIVGERWTKLPRQGAAFEGPVTMTPGTVQVCALFDGAGTSYECLLEYR